MEVLEKLRDKIKGQKWKNNENFLTEGKFDPNEKKPCAICHKMISRSNFNRHLRTHPEYEEQDEIDFKAECTVFLDFFPLLFLSKFPLFLKKLS